MLEILYWLFWFASLAGWLWIIVMAFSEGDTIWGIASIFPLLGLIYGLMNFQEAKFAVALYGGGIIGRILLGVIAATLL